MNKKIQVDDFLKNHILTNLKINEDQTFGLYFDNTLDIESNEYKKSVMMLNIENFKSEKLKLDINTDDFFYSGNLIFFKEINDDKTTFYSYDIDKNKLEKEFIIPFEVKEVSFSSEKIYFTAIVQKFDLNSKIKCSARAPFYEEGKGIIGDSVTGLFKYSTDEKIIELITSLDMDIDQVDFDFENNRIMFTAFKKETLKPIASYVFSYDITSEKLKIYTNGNYRISFIISMTKNNMIFIGVDLTNRSRNDNQQIYIINEKDATFKQLGKYVDKSNENPSVITDSVFSTSKPINKFRDEFYFIRIERDKEMLYKIDIKGNISNIETGLKVINSYQIIDKGILLIGLKGTNLHELYLYSEDKLNKLSHFNEWLFENILSKGEKISFIHENIEIDGWVFPPVNIEKDKIYPGVLMIHGGPKMIYSDVYAHDVQLLCSNGYYVFYANPMGSDGRGDKFSNIRGKFGKLPYMQLMEFTDKVLELYPMIDKSSLGVTGGSYGGYMTNYIITRTNRFKAAVSERGISNLITALTSSDIGYEFIYEYMGNDITPWTNISAYLEESPIMKADKVTAPTLFIHGKDDCRCNYTESLNMYSAINYFGIETKFCIFEEENHGLVVKGKPKSKQRRYEEMLNWFNKYLKEEKSNGIG